VNKIIIVIVIVTIIGIGVTASSISMESTEDEAVDNETRLVLDETIPVKEEPKETGRDLTVELTESIGLKSP